MTSATSTTTHQRPALTLVEQPAHQRPPRDHAPWTDAEDAVLRAEYGWGKAPALAARLGRGIVATRTRARHLGLARTVAARITWPGANDALLRAQYGRIPTPELAARLGTTVDAVWWRARAVGVARAGVYHPFTPEEDRLLRELVGTMPRAQLAARLGRSPAAVSGRMTTLRLTREGVVARRYVRDQDEIARLRGEVQRLRDRGGPDAAHAPSDDARRLAVLVGYRMQVISPAEAAVTLGVPVERLPVELGKAAARGLEVVRDAIGGGP